MFAPLFVVYWPHLVALPEGDHNLSGVDAGTEAAPKAIPTTQAPPRAVLVRQFWDAMKFFSS
jgi:hypothetical protein